MLKHVYLRVMNVQKYLKKQKNNNGNIILKKSCNDYGKEMKNDSTESNLLTKNERKEIGKETDIDIETEKTKVTKNEAVSVLKKEGEKEKEKETERERERECIKNEKKSKKCREFMNPNMKIGKGGTMSILMEENADRMKWKWKNLLEVKEEGKEEEKKWEEIYEKVPEEIHEEVHENVHESEYQRKTVKIKELDMVLKYASEQIRKSLLLNPHFINSKEFYMSLSLICNQLATNGFTEKTFWQFLSSKLTEFLKLPDIYETMCIRWLALILNSFARVHFLNTIFLEEAILFIKHYPNDDLHSFDISQIVNSYAKLGYFNLSLFFYLEKMICERKEEMSCQSLSNICNAYSKMSHHFENLFLDLSKSIKEKITKFNEQEIANIVNSYSKLQNIDLDLFYQFIKQINNRIFCFKPVEIVMIANAYSKCNIYKKSLFDNISMYILQNENCFTPIELCVLANSYGKYGKCNIKEMRIFDIIKKGIMEKEHLLGPGNIAMLLHAYGKVAIRENTFLLNIIKRTKHFIQHLDCRNLTLIYVSVIKLNLDIPLYIYNDMKYFILKKKNQFTDLALVSIGYSSLFYKYFDLMLVSTMLVVLNKRKAHSKSFAHQIQVILFVLHSLYDFSKFSYRFLICLNNLLKRASLYATKANYYDINKSSMQKKISHFLPRNCHVLTEVSVGPFVVDFLLLHKHMYNHTRYMEGHRSLM